MIHTFECSCDARLGRGGVFGGWGGARVGGGGHGLGARVGGGGARVGGHGLEGGARVGGHGLGGALIAQVVHGFVRS